MNQIGFRATQAIRDMARRNGHSVRQECEKLDISQQNYNNWEKHGTNPGAYFLREMVLAGYDVIWILTGGCNG